MSRYIAIENEIRGALTQIASQEGLRDRLTHLVVPVSPIRGNDGSIIDLQPLVDVHADYPKTKPARYVAVWPSGEQVSPLGLIGGTVDFREPLHMKPHSVVGKTAGWVYSADSTPVTLAPNDPGIPAMIAWAHHRTFHSCRASHMPDFALRIRRRIAGVKVARLAEVTTDESAGAGLSCITKDGGQTLKYGLADRDGLPGTDNTGWPWSEWSTDPREALEKMLRQKYRRMHETNAAWVWVYKVARVEPGAKP